MSKQHAGGGVGVGHPKALLVCSLSVQGELGRIGGGGGGSCEGL